MPRSALTVSALLAVTLLAGRPASAQTHRATDLGPVAFTSIAGNPEATRLAGVSACDNCSETVSLPFSFDWYGTLVTDIRVTSNGQLDMSDQPGHICCSAPKIPDADGNEVTVLVAVRFAADVELSWAPASDAWTYSLYRGTDKGVWPTPAYRTGLRARAVSEPDVAGPPDLYLCRVSGVGCGGLERPWPDKP